MLTGLGNPHHVWIVCAPNMHKSYVTSRLYPGFAFEIIVNIGGSRNTIEVIFYYNRSHSKIYWNIKHRVSGDPVLNDVVEVL